MSLVTVISHYTGINIRMNVERKIKIIFGLQKEKKKTFKFIQHASSICKPKIQDKQRGGIKPEHGDGRIEWMGGLTSSDLRSAAESEQSRSTRSGQEGIMGNRKEEHDIKDRQDRETSCLGRECHRQQCEKRQRVFYGEVFGPGSSGEKGTGDQNQKTAITSQMALTLHGFEEKFQI